MRDAPEAFGSTYERELARTMADWQRWLSPGVTLILEQDENPRGLVAGMIDKDDPTIAHLLAMWVHAENRGSGAADALASRLLSWAADRNARLVRLDVIASNERARRFYERIGFRLTGHQAFRERDGAVEVQMECRVFAGMP